MVSTCGWHGAGAVGALESPQTPGIPRPQAPVQSGALHRPVSSAAPAASSAAQTAVVPAPGREVPGQTQATQAAASGTPTGGAPDPALAPDSPAPASAYCLS